jgi:hypothetical protein
MAMVKAGTKLRIIWLKLTETYLRETFPIAGRRNQQSKAAKHHIQTENDGKAQYDLLRMDVKILLATDHHAIFQQSSQPMTRRSSLVGTLVIVVTIRPQQRLLFFITTIIIIILMHGR